MHVCYENIITLAWINLVAPHINHIWWWWCSERSHYGSPSHGFSHKTVRQNTNHGENMNCNVRYMSLYLVSMRFSPISALCAIGKTKCNAERRYGRWNFAKNHIFLVGFSRVICLFHDKPCCGVVLARAILWKCLFLFSLWLCVRCIRRTTITIYKTIYKRRKCYKFYCR